MTKDEALALALEALELEDMACRYEKESTPEHIAKAITAIKQVLALDKMADNARDLGLDYEPADGTQVSKVWWDGEKLMAKPIPFEDIYQSVDWKAEYLKSVESGCITLDELREARAELDATNRQVEILSDALAESRREVVVLKAVHVPHKGLSEHLAQATNGRVYVDPVTGDVGIGTPAAPVQEPVAQCTVDVSGAAGPSCEPLNWHKTAAQPAVPDAIHHTDLSETLEYIQGWNACRQATLEMMK
jgi:hypothetical protein